MTKNKKTLNTDVEIIKPASKLIFTCDECDCVFKVLKHKCEFKQTGLQEYNYVYNCPECGNECYGENER